MLTKPDSALTYRLARSLLAIEIEAPDRRHLVTIPVNAVVEQTSEFASASGFVTIRWQARTYLVFDEDLQKQPTLLQRVSGVGHQKGLRPVRRSS